MTNTRLHTISPASQESFSPYTCERVWDDASELANESVKRILVAGDVHGDAYSFDLALQHALRNECDVLVQVGDFWLEDSSWERFAPDRVRLMVAAKRSPIPVVVIDGNHEAWPTLATFAKTPECRAALAAGKPVHLGGSLWWALRGSVWRWSDLTVGALGGAVSPDKHLPQTHGWRWPEEAITDEDLERLLANTPEGGLDVLLTHDAPTQVKGVQKAKMAGVPTYIEIEADESRRLLARAVTETKPQLLFHGHWHLRNREMIAEHTLVVGLNCNLRDGFTAVASLSPELSASYSHPYDTQT